MAFDLGRLRQRFRRLFISALGTRERIRPRTRLVFALLIFFLSFATRSLQAVDLSPLMFTAEQPFGGLTRGYDRRAQSILSGEGLLGPYDIEPSKTMWLAQAPGYSIYLSAVYRIAGRNFFNVQLIQNSLNSLSPVLIFLIAGRVLSWRVGLASGVLAALSHHLSHISNFILPDSLAALPVLASIYLIVRARETSQDSYWPYSAAGLLLGLAAWLRPQTMLLSMFLAAMLVAIAARRLAAMKRAAVMITVSVLTIAPITIRNFLVYDVLLPINIGAGIVMWEGIADASGDRFGAVARDEEVAEQEATLYGDSRYAGSWSTPDGVQRDRDRIKRSLAVIRSHPFWYAGVMFGRMRQMLTYSAYAPLVFDIERARANERTEPIPEGSAISSGDSSLAIGRGIYWLRPILRLLQRVTKEAMQLMIALGALACIIASRRRALLISLVPLYYLLFQSFVHTEFRYTLPMQYFVFVFAAIACVLIASAVWEGARSVINLRKTQQPPVD